MEGWGGGGGVREWFLVQGMGNVFLTGGKGIIWGHGGGGGGTNGMCRRYWGQVGRNAGQVVTVRFSNLWQSENSTWNGKYYFMMH